MDLSQVFLAAQDLLLNSRQLNDPGLMSVPSGTGQNNPIVLKAEKSAQANIGFVNFNVDASVEMDVMLFNDDTDKDPDGFLAAKDDPIIINSATDAYLKYAPEVTLTASANATIPISNFGFDIKLSAEGNARLLYYKRHPNTDIINSAFISDIREFKGIYSLQDIEELPENDAVAFLVNGSLNTDLKVSWSNIFSQSLSLLSGLLPVPVTLDLNITPSLTAEFSVNIIDAFIFLVKKQANDQCLVQVKKTSNIDAKGSFTAEVGVSLKNSADVEAQLEAVYDQVTQALLGNSLSVVNDAITKVKAGIADATSTQIVSELLNLFQLNAVPADITGLLTKITDLEQAIPAKIKQVAEASVELSLCYEYERIDDKSELLSVNIAFSDLQKYHPDLLKFDLTSLLNDLRSRSIAYTLNSYLNQKSLTINRTWGLGLTIFDTTLLMGKSYAQVKDVTQTNLQGAQQITFDRSTGYKWKLGKGAGTWMGEVTAVMKTFVKAPTLDEFEYTLMLDTVLTDPNVKDDDLKTYLDFGVVWNTVQQTDTEKLVQKYGVTTSVLNKTAIVENKLTFSGSAMSQLISVIAAKGWDNCIPYLAVAMANSMPYMDINGRQTAQDRKQIYSSLWEFYLKYDPNEDQDFATTAGDTIGHIGGYDDLGHLEAAGTDQASFAYLIKINPSMLDILKAFISGIVALQNSIDTKAPNAAFNSIFNQINGVFGDDYYIKVIGCFLLLLADEMNTSSGIQKVSSITYGPDDSPTIINFTIAGVA